MENSSSLANQFLISRWNNNNTKKEQLFTRIIKRENNFLLCFHADTFMNSTHFGDGYLSKRHISDWHLSRVYCMQKQCIHQNGYPPRSCYLQAFLYEFYPTQSDPTGRSGNSQVVKALNTGLTGCRFELSLSLSLSLLCLEENDSVSSLLEQPKNQDLMGNR